MVSRRKSRILAVQALYAWDAAGQKETTELLRFSWHDKHRSPDDDSTSDELFFARYLVLGTLESIESVDELIKAQALKWDFTRINKVDLAILRVSIFSLNYTKDIAPSITIDEAIAIAKEYSSPESYRFINGVLDGIRKKIGV